VWMKQPVSSDTLLALISCVNSVDATSGILGGM
jgi:hypothetical protein